ncbi:MAG: dipeptide epimerase [Bacteroidetes bacterium]|nr:dipeptide epimerase [Bacteroidota bacterium]
MIIEHVETWTERLPLTRPYLIATRQVSTVDLHFVRLESRCGVLGFGCAAPTSVTSEDPDDCFAMLGSVGLDILKGQNPHRLRFLTHQLRAQCSDYPSALAALDMALYDLVARSYGISVAMMLGRPMNALPTSITIGILPLDKTLDEAREYLERGFKCLKVKLGLNYEEDIDRLRALRSLCPDHIDIRVDANQGYSIDQTRNLAIESAQLRLELIEQPLKRGDEGDMDHLSKEIRQLMAADESLHGPSDALQLAVGEQFGIWNIKLMKCGGITGALAIADTAQMVGVDLMWGCMDESVISISAALHTGYSCPTTKYIDLDGSFDLSKDVVRDGFRLSDGFLHLLDEPGLGVIVG